MPRIGVILSGCGVFDGSEIHEAVITLLCLDQAGAGYQCMAPNRAFSATNHLTRQPAGQRNVLEESARIARGEIVDLAQVAAADYDGFILPGGFGAARNLCTFANDGPNCQVDPQVQRVLTEARQAGKPIGFLCIAPALAARVFGAGLHPKLTIGHDAGTAAAIVKMGAVHQPCAVGDCVVDGPNRIVTTPAYMEAKSIKEVHAGVAKLVAQVLALIPAGNKPAGR